MKTKKPLWIRLKMYKCPFDKADLKQEGQGEGGLHRCTSCQFTIKHNRLNQILADLYANKKPRVTRDESENQEALSNL